MFCVSAFSGSRLGFFGSVIVIVFLGLLRTFRPFGKSRRVWMSSELHDRHNLKEWCNRSLRGIVFHFSSENELRYNFFSLSFCLDHFVERFLHLVKLMLRNSRLNPSSGTSMENSLYDFHRASIASPGESRPFNASLLISFKMKVLAKQQPDACIVLVS